jgi:predicted transcriptional regulator of viral defense system
MSKASTLREGLLVLAGAGRGGWVTAADARKAWSVSANAAAARLVRYERGGWIRRARRGLYLVLPLEADPAPAAGVEDAWLLAQEAFAPCYIGGWSAGRHWRLTSFDDPRVFVVSAASLRASAATLMGVEFRLAHAPAKRIGWAEPVASGRQKVLISGRELTLSDALAVPAWMGGVTNLAQALLAYRASDAWNPKALLERLGERWSGAAFKRLGWLAERLLPDEKELIDACLARRTSGVIALDPSAKGPGRIQKRWGLRINAEVSLR